MKRLSLLALLIISAVQLIAQNITGTIKDQTSGESLIGASVVIKGTSIGAVTDFDGKFSFNPKDQQAPYTLVISYIGYDSQEKVLQSAATPLNISLGSSKIALKEATKVEQRISEKQKESALTVESMDVIAIKETPAANFYEGLGNLKGVDLTSASIGFKIINTRGFNSTSPVRSLQIIDGVDNQSPGLNFSLGNFLGASDLDVLKVDIIQGASSAFYGPNAFNGVLSMTTKNPFIKPGLAVQFKAGERGLLETAVRYAQVFKNKKGEDKFAYKLNLFYMQAHDWEADNDDPATASRVDKHNPGGYDAVNRYGDENLTSGINNATSIGQQRQFPGLGLWHRDGYWEKDLVSYDSKNLKASLAMHYRLKEDVELIVASNFGTGTTVYQGDNRYSLKDILFFQNRIEINKRDKYFFRMYATNEDAGKSYDAVFTAYLMQNAAKSNNDWSRDYRNFWSQQIKGLISPSYSPLDTYLPGFPVTTFPYDTTQANAVLNMYTDSLNLWHQQARDIANAANSTGGLDYFEPGTATFDSLKNAITSRKSFGEGGTLFYDKSALYHAHGEYKFKPSFMDIIVGANGRLYAPNSEGTIFSDTLDSDSNRIKIYNYEYGIYVGLEKKLKEDKWKFNLTARLDKNKNFNFLVSPAASIIWNPDKNHTLRVSFSAAIRNPTLADQYLYYNVGRAILIGNVTGYDSLITIPSLVNYFNSTTLNKDTLEYFSIDPIRPEKVKTAEIGYRGTLFNRLFIDLNYYFSYYTDFIGYKLAAVARFDTTFTNQINYLQAYRIATNAEGVVTTQGFSIGANLFFAKNFSLNGNYSWNVLNEASSSNDPIIPAFNTPAHKYNVGVSGRDFDLNLFGWKTHHWGFNTNYKWVQGFDYTGSPQFTGFVPSYYAIDAQINKAIPKIHCTIKVGASNLSNNKQFQVYGGPRIGRMGYISLLFELEKKPK